MSCVICSRTQTFLASSIILPHKPKSKNQPLFSNSTKINCLNAAVRHKHTAQFSRSKPSRPNTQHFLIQFHISNDCCMLLRQPLHRMPHTQKNTLHVKPVMLVRIQNPLLQEPTSCKQTTSVSRMRWHLSEPYQQTYAELQWGYWSSSWTTK